jgi:NAD(P)H-dependent flavin oxidoreductase YrpB (nitropropane dioxygenase family)
VDLRAELDLDVPLVAAPMAGGGTTVALAAAAVAAGGCGFLAAGYRTADDVAAQLDEARAVGLPVAINLFAPNPVPVDRAAYLAYRDALHAEAEALGVDLPTEPRDDDDGWSAKLEVMRAHPPRVLSCTFGLPDRDVIAELRRAGTIVLQTVTSAAEAQQSMESGVDGLVVQSSAAGGHWGTFTPHRPPPALALPDLLGAVRATVGPAVPLVGAGGVGTAADVATALAAGADLVAVGTVLLRCHESGAHPTHRAALADPAGRSTVVTRAFTGRPARGLRNGFIERHEAEAPLGYPALHHLTSALRRAAAAAGDADRLHLWAGTAHAESRDEPLAAAFARLTPT